MIICKNCGRQLPDGNQFCDTCGAPLYEQQPQQYAQPQQNYQYTQDQQYAQPQQNYQYAQDQQYAQQQYDQYQQTPQYTQPQYAQPQAAYAANTPAAKSSGKGKKILLIVAIVLLTVVVAAIAASFLLNGGSKQNYLYVKDNTIYATSGSAEGHEVTDRLGSSYDDIRLKDYKLNSNGTRIFYADDNGLYWNVTTDKKSEPTKIASSVSSFEIDANGDNVVLYTDSNDLYKYNVAKDEKEKISSNVGTYRCDESLNKIIFLTYDESLYFVNGNSDKEKIDSDVSSWDCNSDYTVFYYSKDDSYYKKSAGSEEKEKLISGFYSSLAIFPDSGKIYYTKESKVTIKYSDVVIDDLADSDSKMSEPVEPEYPTRGDYPDYPFSFDFKDEKQYEKAVEEYDKKVEEIDAAYEKAYEEYQDAYEKYQNDRDEYSAKLSRDELRKQINEGSAEFTKYPLYYYNGSEEKLIDDNYGKECLARLGKSKNYSTPVMAYKRSAVSDNNDGAKLKLSQINSVYDIESRLNDTSYSSSTTDNSSTVYIAREDKILELSDSFIGGFTISEDGKTVYYMVGSASDSSQSKDLYKADISGDTISEGVKICEDVAQLKMITSDGHIVYMKGTGSTDSLDLYIDDTLVDNDVYNYANIFYQDGTLYYATDYSSSSSKATLKCKGSGDSVKIKDDVSLYSVLPDGAVVFLYDYSTSSYTGELYIYNGGKAEKVDDDVQIIVPITDSRAEYESAFSYNTSYNYDY